MTDGCSSKTCTSEGTGNSSSIEKIRTAVRLEQLSLVWMTIEALVSLGTGIAAGSLLLVAFGADSVIELLSAVLLYAYLLAQARGTPQDEEVFEQREHKTAKIAGYLLYGLSVYVVAQALYGLTHRHHAETSWLGMAIVVIAALGMPLLARGKLRIAEQIGSRALRADAMETITCGYLSWVVLIGLVADAFIHWWWVDSVFSLAIVPLLVKEAREAISGEECCEDEKNRSSAQKNGY